MPHMTYSLHYKTGLALKGHLSSPKKSKAAMTEETERGLSGNIASSPRMCIK